MDYEFRKRLYELDEIGFVGKPNSKVSKKDEYILSTYFRASRKMWHEEGRCFTEEEKNKVIQDAIKDYNREVRQRRKLKTLDKVASITL